MSPPVLNSGNCERVKAAVHGVALVRRERHLAVNGLFYSAAVMWEIVHVRHHLAATPPLPALVCVRDERGAGGAGDGVL